MFLSPYWSLVDTGGDRREIPEIRGRLAGVSTEQKISTQSSGVPETPGNPGVFAFSGRACQPVFGGVAPGWQALMQGTNLAPPSLSNRRPNRASWRKTGHCTGCAGGRTMAPMTAANATELLETTEVAQLFGVNRSTINRWAKRELLVPVAVSRSGRRFYDGAVIRQLAAARPPQEAPTP